ncbi:DUF1254 domain-containing protein [Novosphingobium sp.]|uniref:DUF1254 domain-containing protein n=1 Tax=Novosphingobium sp. TaxID=1874826 RepID=UPI0025E5B7CA|nr:DUF1254 domain-containing protein [Novosphingobium sp.]MCC6925668.1 DUF1254 domain-containing protein [Novosphingobium sp.]
MLLLALAAAAALPDPAQCQAAANDPEVALAQSVGLQGFIYGYPIVDMSRQRFNETHRTSPDQPVAAPVNTIAVYPHLLTPSTQGQLRAPNSDTLYLNAWIDLARGPVLIEVPAMGQRYYTLAFMDFYSAPHHLGTRSNGGKAMRYALVGPSGGEVPPGYEVFRLPTDTAWMLGRVLVDGPQDEAKAQELARAIVMKGAPGEPVSQAAPLQPMDSLAYFSVLNQALKTLPRQPGEEALMALFDRAGFGPSASFDPAKLGEKQALGLGCAVRIGPQVLAKSAFKPSFTKTGWLQTRDLSNPGNDYLLRAEVVRGGYVNAREESVYPAAVMDSQHRPLTGTSSYRIHFSKGQLPPVDAFWSLTPYAAPGMQLTENALRRYSIGSRTKGLKFAPDGSLTLTLSATRPREGVANWLPIPAGAFTLVARLYLPRPEVLDGRYDLPPVERIER